MYQILKKNAYVHYGANMIVKDYNMRIQGNKDKQGNNPNISGHFFLREKEESQETKNLECTLSSPNGLKMQVLGVQIPTRGGSSGKPLVCELDCDRLYHRSKYALEFKETLIGISVQC